MQNDFILLINNINGMNARINVDCVAKLLQELHLQILLDRCFHPHRASVA